MKNEELPLRGEMKNLPTTGSSLMIQKKKFFTLHS